MFHPDNLSNEMGRQHSFMLNEGYPEHRNGEVKIALLEAWAWLEAQGLIIPAPDTNGTNGWRVLSRRVRKFESEVEFANYAAARRLPRESLHPTIAGPVWNSFMRGEFDVAVFLALKAVEVAVRTAGGYAANDIGVPLMRKAFHPENGPLTDMSAEPAERHALSDLFAGAIGSFKTLSLTATSHSKTPLKRPRLRCSLVTCCGYSTE